MNDELRIYLEQAKRFPMLSLEEEKDLIARWRQRGDQDALQSLLGSHLRLVIKIARENRGYGLPLGDLIGEGNVGLMQAAERFDPERGVRFASYAAWWIRATIREHVLYSRSLVKMGTTAAQKKLFFNLGRLKSDLQVYDDGDLAPEVANRIAEELDVQEAEVVEMNRRLMAGDWTLNAPVSDEDGGEFQDLLVSDAPDPEAVLGESEELAWRKELLGEALDSLSAREQRILKTRKLSEEPRTLEDLSQEYGISRERVRQIEARAIERLRERMLEAAEQARAATIEAGADLPAELREAARTKVPVLAA